MLQFIVQHFATNFYSKVGFYVIGSVIGSLWYHNPIKLKWYYYSNSLTSSVSPVLNIEISQSFMVGIALMFGECALLGYIMHSNAVRDVKNQLCERIEKVIRKPKDMDNIRKIIEDETGKLTIDIVDESSAEISDDESLLSTSTDSTIYEKSKQYDQTKELMTVYSAVEYDNDSSEDDLTTRDTRPQSDIKLIVKEPSRIRILRPFSTDKIVVNTDEEKKTEDVSNNDVNSPFTTKVNAVYLSAFGVNNNTDSEL
ncbi:uncharacterized protein LOC119687696 [Teleopsis dalmanni]|uniref:uncharacterized protein LOC119687696 n=1 Tax=Teleopsis dalmanni TaxID=139649 RepID=UPI0018CCCCA4|nr:uncharacterized protein LOC119687696 [Teleopsis dalmanni]